jgi:hypothetical protein
MSWVAAAVAGGAIVGGVASSVIGGNAAKSAANTQADAATYSADLQNQAIQQERTDLQPYAYFGQSSINPLIQALGYNAIQGENGLYSWTKDGSSPLQQTFSYGDFTAPTGAEAAATPGYQFTLDQGLKAAQNSASARGLGSSGAAIKGAEKYATGLADSTYGDTYNRSLSAYTTNRNNALGNFTTNYGVASDNANKLLGLVTLGQNSAAMQGATGVQGANSVANTVASAANAQAAGTVGAANAATSGISTAVNGGTNALLLSTLNKTPTTMYGSGSFNPNYQSSYSGIDNPSNYG